MRRRERQARRLARRVGSWSSLGGAAHPARAASARAALFPSAVPSREHMRMPRPQRLSRRAHRDGRARRSRAWRRRRPRCGAQRASEGKWAETGPAGRRLSRSSGPERARILPPLLRGGRVSLFRCLLASALSRSRLCSLSLSHETRAARRASRAARGASGLRGP